jgi:phosphoglycolate phosphatase-like HAD superfamily hydrolase
LFWDIDGTLLKTNGAAALALEEAISTYSGSVVSIDRKKSSGYTDYEIIQQQLLNIGITIENKEITKVLESYSLRLEYYLSQGKIELVNNVDLTLRNLIANPNIEIAIGSGNCLSGAKIKLNHLSLLNFFQTYNLFCASEENWHRDAIISEAKQSLKKNQIGVVIGDSPKDITSALNSNLYVIAIPTGQHTIHDLLNFNPHFILKANWTHQDLVECLKNLIKITKHHP